MALMPTFKETMTDSEPQSIKGLLENQSTVGNIIAKARQLLRIDEILQMALPPELTRYVQTMNYTGSVLTLEVSGAAWATKIRYQEREIIQALKHFPELRTLVHVVAKVRV